MSIDDNYLSIRLPHQSESHFRIGWQVALQKIPGSSYNSSTSSYILPLHRITITALRDIFTTHPVPGGNTNIDVQPGDVFLTLKKIADSEDDEIFLNSEQTRIIFNLPQDKRYENAMKTCGKTTKSGYSTSIKRAKDVVSVFTSQCPEVRISQKIIDMAKTKNKAIEGLPAEATLKNLAETPVSSLDSITPLMQKRISRVGISNLYDLLLNYPLKYVNRTDEFNPAALKVGDEVTFKGRITHIETPNKSYSKDNKKSYIKYSFESPSGHKISSTFFNQRWLLSNFKEGMEVIVHGKYGIWKSKSGRITKQINGAKIEHADTSQAAIPFIPIYRQFPSLNLTSNFFNKVMQEMIGRIKDNHKIIMPNEELSQAVLNIHLPETQDILDSAKNSLVYNELMMLQLFIQSNRKFYIAHQGIASHRMPDGAAEAMISNLPYRLTDSQSRAYEEISDNMGSERPMHRLLQGDVGSGKTTLAYFTALNAIDNGHQAAIVAPTEILARQLMSGLEELLNERDISYVFLGGKATAKQREQDRAKIASGDISLVFGTHAVIQDSVTFKDLAALIIDEQHRFGVDQRTKLIYSRDDGLVPDVLFMTATPIPRTSALVAYGDMDITTINELPPGRIPVATDVITKASMGDFFSSVKKDPWRHVLNEIRNGHQVYVVSPLIEESDKSELKSVEETIGALLKLMPGAVIDCVHGGMKPEERNEMLKSFSEGNIEVLVSTTVIEVGINVPNATVMVILNAERFGISQLHQLRGRVGRSSLPSRCFLLSDTESPISARRLNAVASTNDGFELAEEDLRIRGEGTIFSTEQSGVTDLKIASIFDVNKISEAKREADDILSRRDLTPVEEELIALMFNERSISS